MNNRCNEYNELIKQIEQLAAKIECEANAIAFQEKNFYKEGKVVAYSHVFFELKDILESTKDKEREREENAMLLLLIILACVIGSVLGSLFIYPFLKAFLDQL